MLAATRPVRHDTTSRRSASPIARQWFTTLRCVRAFLFGLALTAATSTGFASDGELDSGFGVNGVARVGGNTAYMSGPPTSMVVQPDGRIVMCATSYDFPTDTYDFLVSRLNVDGSPDTTFSFDGRTSVDFLSGDRCWAVALQGDGKIVAAGASEDRFEPSDADSDFVVTRLNPDGTLDTTFGGGSGKVRFGFDLMPLGDNDVASAVAVQANGRIVLAGWATRGSGYDFAIARLLPDGARDPAFNLTGKAVIPFDAPGGSSSRDGALGVAIDNVGRIVVAGHSGVGIGGDVFAVARILPNGQLDGDFDADGKATVDFHLGDGATANAVRLQRDGRVVLAGQVNVGNSEPNIDVALARLFPDGSLDASFGIGGKTVVGFDLIANGDDIAYSIAEQGNGKLVFGIHATPRGAVVRLNRDGSLDEQFGSFGRMTYDPGLDTLIWPRFGAIALHGSRILLGGKSGVPGPSGSADAIVLGLRNDLLFASGME